MSSTELIEVRALLARSGHGCAQARCLDRAARLVLESHVFAMLVPAGAGFFCERHAKQMETAGGVIVTHVGRDTEAVGGR